MTGLFNKNKYLQMKEEYYAGMEAVGVVFWDVNNLKQTNDTLGHEQGDLLIRTTAQMMKNLITANREVYRIGGDEFIMVVSHPAEGEMQEIEKRWSEMEGQIAGTLEIPYSVATGMAVGTGKNLEGQNITTIGMKAHFKQ